MAPPWAITAAQRPNLPRAHASLDGEVCGTMWKRGTWYIAQCETDRDFPGVHIYDDSTSHTFCFHFGAGCLAFLFHFSRKHLVLMVQASDKASLTTWSR